MSPTHLQQWHQMIESRDTKLLEPMLADDCVFESPVVHTPQVGKAISFQYLRAAMNVLNNESFRYLREWDSDHSAVLEFTSECEGILINGVDMIEWNAEGKITHFKVMVRPLKAVNKLHELMGRILQSISKP